MIYPWIKWDNGMITCIFVTKIQAVKLWDLMMYLDRVSENVCFTYISSFWQFMAEIWMLKLGFLQTESPNLYCLWCFRTDKKLERLIHLQKVRLKIMTISQVWFILVEKKWQTSQLKTEWWIKLLSSGKEVK